MNRLILSVIKKYFKLFLSTILVSSLGCAIMTGLSGGLKSLTDSFDMYVHGGYYPDSIISTSITNKDIKNRLSQISGVEKVDSRLTADTFIVSPKDRLLSVSVFSFHDSDSQKFYFWESVNPESDEFVYLDYQLASGNDIHAGDRIRIRIDEDYRIYTVAGIVSRPETLAIETQSNRYSTNSDFGYVYAPEKLLAKESEDRRSESISALTEKEDALKEMEDKAEELLSEAEAEVKIAQITLGALQTLYGQLFSLSDGDRKELMNLRTQLQNLSSSITQLRDQIETLDLYMQSLLDEADYSSLLLEQAVNGYHEILALEQQLIEARNQIAGADVEALVNLLGQMGNYNISSLLQSVACFQNFLSVLQSYGLTYDISEYTDVIIDRMSAYLSQCEEDFSYLVSDRAAALIVRIAQGDPSVIAESEYTVLKSVLLKYDASCSDETILYSYENTVNNLHTIVSYSEIYQFQRILPVIRSFGSSASLYEMLVRAEEIGVIAEIISSYSERPIETTYDLIAAFHDAADKINSAYSELMTQKKKIETLLISYGITLEDVDDVIAQLEDQKLNIEQLKDSVSEALSGIDQVLENISEGINLINELIGYTGNAFGGLNVPADLSAYENEVNLKRAESKKQFGDLRLELEKAWAELDESEGYENLANQFLIYCQEGADPKTVMAKAEKILKEEAEVKTSISYEDSPVKYRIDSNVDPMVVMSYFVPYLFFGIVLVVVFLFMSLMIRQCRREIGILRALGFTRTKVTGIFCLINLAGSVMAIGIGLVLGIISARVVENLYIGFFPLPVYCYTLDYKMFIVSAVLTIIVGQVATILSAHTIASVSPAEVMSRTISEQKEMPKLIDRLMRRVSPLTKFSVVSLIRTPMKFLFSVICISATIVLILLSVSVYASTNYIIDHFLEKQILYDAELYFLEPPNEEVMRELKERSYVSDIHLVTYYYSEFSKDGLNEKAIIKTIDQDNQLIGIYADNGEKLRVNENEIILDPKTAKILKAKKGDTVEIDGISFEVQDVAAQNYLFSSFISDRNHLIASDPVYYSLICKMETGRQEELLGYLSKSDNYLYSLFSDVSERTMKKSFHLYDQVIMIIIIFAVIIGLIIIMNTAMTNILEKKKELSVLRTLGFQHRDISRSWFSQSVLFFICSCLIGIPVGIRVTKICLEKLSTDDRIYVYANTPKEYLITLGLVLLYICIAHVLTMRRFGKWDMIENVQDKE